LSSAGLETYEKGLRELGVEHPGDLVYLDDSAVDLLKPKPIHRKKLISLIHDSH
jgi:hypothetical protein